MKILFLLLFIFTINLEAQDYISMLKTENNWSVEDNNDFGSPYYFQFTVSGSEIINGVEYLKLFNKGEETACRLREDDGKVFRLNLDQTESLVIDFTLEMGDQFILERTNNPCPREYINYIDRFQVVNIDYEYIASEQRKVLTMQAYVNDQIYENLIEKWIEGIGSTRSFIPDNHGLVNGAEARYLNCFTQNGETTFFNDASFCGEELNISDFFIKKIILYPNPITSTSILKLPENELVYTIKVYNILGRLIKEETTANHIVKITNINYNSGLYFYQVYSNSKLLRTSQFLIK